MLVNVVLLAASQFAATVSSMMMRIAQKKRHGFLADMQSFRCEMPL
jgi:hypothetical protein